MGCQRLLYSCSSRTMPCLLADHPGLNSLNIQLQEHGFKVAQTWGQMSPLAAGTDQENQLLRARVRPFSCSPQRILWALLKGSSRSSDLDRYPRAALGYQRYVG